MKTRALAICFLLVIVLNGGGVEGRRHNDRRRSYKQLFVFGDSFADDGNGQESRAWSYPYGSSDSAHGNRATGRFSDGLLQSDFLASMILGREESPPPYRLRKANSADPSGLNFAVAGAGVLDWSQEVPSLGHQIDQQFGRLLDLGIIDQDDLDDSVAVVAIAAGRDYYGVNGGTSNDHRMDLSLQVTDGIVDGVRRLQKLGVGKVLVNTLPPFGCTPWVSRNNNYTYCDSLGNSIATTHNTALKHKLDGVENVLVLDLYTIFSNLIHPSYGSSSPLKRKFTPCCEASEPQGYCGQTDQRGNAMYSVCSTPTNFFYWDYMHPTQAGWEAVMDRLQGPIQDFLGIR